MGLDVYLRAKTTKREYKGSTGACSGFFPCAPADDGMVEIGYWRKAYDQDEVISLNISALGDNCDNRLVTPVEVDEILEAAKQILATHTFDDEGYDTSEDYHGWGTWQSKFKWEQTIEFFTEAKRILEEDPDAEIYYCVWY